MANRAPSDHHGSNGGLPVLPNGARPSGSRDVPSPNGLPPRHDACRPNANIRAPRHTRSVAAEFFLRVAAAARHPRRFLGGAAPTPRELQKLTQATETLTETGGDWSYRSPVGVRRFRANYVPIDRGRVHVGRIIAAERLPPHFFVAANVGKRRIAIALQIDFGAVETDLQH